MNNSIIKQEKIGSGAFGDVFKVTTADKEVYAVKTFKNIVDPKMIINEINILCKLQHPNIVRIYANEKLNFGAFSMIMEFCPTDLRKAIKAEQGITPSRACRLFTEILKGINYIHGQNVVHGDLKPENIFLDSTDSIKIGDFGLTRYCYSPACHGLLQGSFPYMAPEALKIPSEYSSKTDMYAIGIIAFEMFVKLDSTRFWEFIQKLKKDPQRVTYDHLACVNISPMDYKIIPQLLSADPQKRPSAGDLLANYSAGNSCSWTPPKQQANARETWLASGVLNIALVCVLILAVIVFCVILIIKTTTKTQNKKSKILSDVVKVCC